MACLVVENVDGHGVPAVVVVYNAAVEHVCVLVISKGDGGVSQRERPLQGGDPRDRFVACSKPAATITKGEEVIRPMILCIE